MKILIIGSSAWLGGSELAIIETIEVLKSRGHQVYMIFPWEGEMVTRLAPVLDGYSIIYYKWWMSDTPVNWRYKLSYWKAEWKAIPAIVKAIQDWQIEKVITNTLVHGTGAKAAIKAKVPLYWYIHEMGEEDQNFHYPFGREKAYQVMSKSAGIITNSQMVYDKFVKVFGQQKTKLVYYVVPQKQVAESLNSNPTVRPLELLMLSRIHPVKGQMVAVKALAFLKGKADVRLTLCGHQHEEYVAELNSEAQKSGVSDMLNILSFTKDVTPVIAQSDVMLICSANEAFGRVTIEAMKQGRIPIAANTGGSLEIIKHGVNGFHFQVDNPQSLAEVILQLSQSKDQWAAIAERAKADAEQLCNPNRHYQDLMAVLEMI